MTTFQDLGLHTETLQALTKKGFVTPSPIQEKVIPLLLKGETNIIGQAATGTGKTAAFGIPLIENLQSKNKVQALILAPTRELATQIAEEIESFQGAHNRLKVMAIYGKQSYDIQIRALKKGIDILVGTPGRIMDHLNRKTLDLSNVSYFILDEADEMLDMGFIEDIETIFKATSQDKKVLLFSATMPKEILQIAKKYIGNYELIAIENTQKTGENTDQTYFEVQEKDKFELLRRIIDTEHEFYGIIFCHTKSDVDELVSRLNDNGYSAEGLHGDLAQKQREYFLQRFKDKKVHILVATDIAARGIDVNDVTHVINYAIPQNAERYTHRIGRTGRAGKTGTAITFITPREYSKISYIKKVNKVDIKKGLIPEISGVIEKKKQQLNEHIQGVLTKQSHLDYQEVADRLIENNNPRDIVAALLKMNYENDFDQSKYRDIADTNRERRGEYAGNKVRLFVALGRREGYTARSLLELISKKSGVANREIDDLKMMDDFSFISVSKENADIITGSFANQTINGKKDIINKAKESDKNRNEKGGRREYRPSRGRDERPSRSSYPQRESSRYGKREFGDKKEFGSKKEFGPKKSFGDYPPRKSFKK